MTKKATLDDFIRIGAQLRLIKDLYTMFTVDVLNTLSADKYFKPIYKGEDILTQLSSDLDDEVFGAYNGEDLSHIFYGAVDVRRDDVADKAVHEAIGNLLIEMYKKNVGNEYASEEDNQFRA